jgi:hypothetical protein
MANTTPTPVSFLKAVNLCFMLLFRREQFLKAELADNQVLKTLATPSELPVRSDVVRHAFAFGFLLVAASAVFGWVLGYVLQLALQCLGPKAIMLLQLLGTCLLLWGTLFVRGWDIQTFGGVTYTERVNQWLYKFLYCAGTALIVCSLVGSPCAS